MAPSTAIGDQKWTTHTTPENILMWLKLSRITALVMNFIVHLLENVTNLLEEFYCLASSANTSRLHKANCKLEEGGGCVGFQVYSH